MTGMVPNTVASGPRAAATGEPVPGDPPVRARGRGPFGSGLDRLPPRLGFLAGRPDLVGVVLLNILLVFALLQSPKQLLTGDEPRYLLYATSFVRHGQLVMPLQEWAGVVRHATGSTPNGLPVGGGNQVVMNSVYLPVALSPVAGLLSLRGLRLVTLLVGTAGLFFLFRLCCRVASPRLGLLAAALAAFSVPLLPYLHLFYMETFLFALVCWGWDRLQQPERTLRGDLLTATILILIPFVHMRGAVVAACLFAALLWRLRTRGSWRRAAGLGLFAASAGMLFVALNLHIYGAITGPVNTARPPAPWAAFGVLAMQLFNVHHGLLAYAPLWMLGYAGMWASLRGGPPVARQALVLAAVAAVSGVGVNPGECWPARFWVLSVPMLAVGLCFWMSRARGVAARACMAGLLALTLANSILFLWRPNLFLDNRQSSVTWDDLYRHLGFINPGLFLPFESSDPAAVLRADCFAAAAVLFVVLAALSVRWCVAAIPALFMLLAAADLCRVAVLPSRLVAITMDATHLRATFLPAPRVVSMELGHRELIWFAEPGYPRFDTTVVGRAGRVAGEMPANPRVGGSCNHGVRSIDVVAHGMTLPPDRTFPITVYVNRSFIRRLPLNNDC